MSEIRDNINIELVKKNAKSILNGEGLDRSDFPKSNIGKLANLLWDTSPSFSLGCEYGYLMALRDLER